MPSENVKKIVLNTFINLSPNTKGRVDTYLLSIRHNIGAFVIKLDPKRDHNRKRSTDRRDVTQHVRRNPQRVRPKNY